MSGVCPGCGKRMLSGEPGQRAWCREARAYVVLTDGGEPGGEAGD